VRSRPLVVSGEATARRNETGTRTPGSRMSRSDRRSCPQARIAAACNKKKTQPSGGDLPAGGRERDELAQSQNEIRPNSTIVAVVEAMPAVTRRPAACTSNHPGPNPRVERLHDGRIDADIGLALEELADRRGESPSSPMHQGRPGSMSATSLHHSPSIRFRDSRFEIDDARSMRSFVRVSCSETRIRSRTGVHPRIS